ESLFSPECLRTAERSSAMDPVMTHTPATEPDPEHPPATDHELVPPPTMEPAIAFIPEP
ncbi:hypothetical protein ABG768_026222, partial [Culter alburnus]